MSEETRSIPKIDVDDAAVDTAPAPSVVFSDDDIERINSSLSEPVDPRRRELLPQILRDWGLYDLPDIELSARRPSAQRRDRVRAVGERARKLVQALAKLDEVDRTGIAGEMVRGKPLVDAWTETQTAIEMIEETTRFLAKLAEAADQTWVYGRGQPRNIRAYRVVLDVAAIFEWLTGTKATRETDRQTGKDINAFHEFLAAIWPVIFSQGVNGLSSAMKNWAEWSAEHRETSAVIANIALRNPDWEILPKIARPSAGQRKSTLTE